MLGAGVAGVSLYLGEQFAFFIVVGVIFLIAGVYKGVSGWMLRKKETHAETELTRVRGMPHKPTHQWLRCPRCHRYSHPIAQFCYACGIRMR